MNNIKSFIKKRNEEIYSILEAFDETEVVYNFCFSIKTLKVTYSYTNAKSNKRKQGVKYFIGNFGNCSKASHRTMLQMWVQEYNKGRKYPIINVSLEDVEVEDSLSLSGPSAVKSFLGRGKSIYDIADVKKIDSLMDILKKKPSMNKMDYVFFHKLKVETSIMSVEYETVRGNIKKRNFAVVSMESESSNKIYSLYNSDYNKVARFIKDYNEKYPFKQRNLLSVQRCETISSEELS